MPSPEDTAISPPDPAEVAGIDPVALVRPADLEPPEYEVVVVVATLLIDAQQARLVERALESFLDDSGELGDFSRKAVGDVLRQIREAGAVQEDSSQPAEPVE